MLVNNITEAVIYESPDGGKTVFIRKPGDTHRELYWESPEAQAIRQEMADSKLWNEIRAAAKTNETLQRALDEAVLIYQLSK